MKTDATVPMYLSMPDLKLAEEVFQMIDIQGKYAIYDMSRMQFQ